MEDTMAARERAREFGIVRWASAVASVIVDDVTDRAPLNDADESPTIAYDGDGYGVGNSGAGALARGGGAL